jgi:hypothetical protein
MGYGMAMESVEVYEGYIALDRLDQLYCSFRICIDSDVPISLIR